MKNYYRKKIITITVLAVAAVFLAGGLGVYLDSMANNEPALVGDDNTGQVPNGADVPEIKIPITNERNTQTGGTEGDGTSSQAKTSDGKPKTPAEATMPSLPAETESSTPKSGDINNKGEIYVPGFGWIPNEGGDVKVDEAPNAGTGEKVGDM